MGREPLGQRDEVQEGGGMTKPPPTDAEWQRLGERGERIVTAALSQEATRRLKAGEHQSTALALAFGGLASVARLIRAANKPERADRTERMAVAFLRGAFRGADGPINADSTPYHDGQNG